MTTTTTYTLLNLIQRMNEEGEEIDSDRIRSHLARCQSAGHVKLTQLLGADAPYFISLFDFLSDDEELREQIDLSPLILTLIGALLEIGLDTVPFTILIKGDEDG